MSVTRGWLREPSAIHPGWKCEIPNVKNFLGPETDDEAVHAAAEGVHNALSQWAATDEAKDWGIDIANTGMSGEEYDAYVLWEILDQLVMIAEEPDVSWLNSVLDDLYDWADDLRFVIGGTPYRV